MASGSLMGIRNTLVRFGESAVSREGEGRLPGRISSAINLPASERRMGRVGEKQAVESEKQPTAREKEAWGKLMRGQRYEDALKMAEGAGWGGRFIAAPITSMIISFAATRQNCDEVLRYSMGLLEKHKMGESAQKIIENVQVDLIKRKLRRDGCEEAKKYAQELAGKIEAVVGKMPEDAAEKNAEMAAEEFLLNRIIENVYTERLLGLFHGDFSGINVARMQHVPGQEPCNGLVVIEFGITPHRILQIAQLAHEIAGKRRSVARGSAERIEKDFLSWPHEGGMYEAYELLRKEGKNATAARWANEKGLGTELVEKPLVEMLATAIKKLGCQGAIRYGLRLEADFGFAENALLKKAAAAVLVERIRAGAYEGALEIYRGSGASIDYGAPGKVTMGNEPRTSLIIKEFGVARIEMQEIAEIALRRAIMDRDGPAQERIKRDFGLMG